jgi:hypothetical protein
MGKGIAKMRFERGTELGAAFGVCFGAAWMKKRKAVVVVGVDSRD